jgi:hypothetical protein
MDGKNGRMPNPPKIVKNKGFIAINAPSDTSNAPTDGPNGLSDTPKTPEV